MKKKIAILSIISFLIIAIDRVVKIIVNRYIPLNKSISVIKNIFYLTNVHNEGAAFSIMYGLRYILIAISIAFLVFIIYYMYKKKKYNIEFALIIGGLIGNLIDRIVFGYVIDYIGVIIFKYYFPIFNIADALIVIGAIILLFRKDGDKNEVSSK
ncbi:MAG: signal peptidase II [Bacilli bacterium]|nr:signal peptidase II [Bacilli bacterium]